MEEILEKESMKASLEVLEKRVADIERMLDRLDGSLATLWVRFKTQEDRMYQLELKG